MTGEMAQVRGMTSRIRKSFVRRGPGNSQTLRRWVQAGFFVLNLWIGFEFYRWVRFYETGAGWRPDRPPGVEGWLPIASLMNLKVWLLTGEAPRLHAAGMFLLLAFLGISLLLRKAFCSWLCPVGSLSEWLWMLGRETFGRNWQAPRWLDVALRSLKYVLLGLFLYAVGSMTAPAIRAFLEGPYGVVADVKMLNFFRYLSVGGMATLAALIVGSVFIQNLWCRYLCPYGALMGLTALLSPIRIRRAPQTCIDCAKCAKACPSLLPVDRLVSIQSAECTGCMLCVAACPAAGALDMWAGRKRRVPAWAMAATVAIVFLGVCGWARWNGHWATNLPEDVYWDLVPRANQFGHP